MFYKFFTKKFRAGLLGVTLAGAMLGLASLASAQSTPQHRWTFDVGGGVTPVTGQLGQKLNTGWNFTFSGGYNWTSYFTTAIRYRYNGLGVSQSVLREANVPGANSHVWSITAEPRIRFSPDSTFDPYIVGGVGYYRRVVQFTQPTLQPALVFDPFFGFFQGLIPADQVLGTITRNGIGGNAGAGFDFSLGHYNAKFFTEAGYVYGATGAIPTRMVPVTFGIRW